MLLAQAESSQVCLVDHPTLDSRLDDSLNLERPALGLESLLANSGMDGLASHAELFGSFGDRVALV